MLTSARIQGLQAHEDTILSFAPGLTVIHGATNSGKSAIVRALLWALYNKGSVASLQRTGSSQTSVEVSLSSGVGVKRLHTGKANQYYLRQPDGTSLPPFETVGRDVPDPVVHATGFIPVRLDKDASKLGTPLNIASQHDGLFLITEPPSSVQRQLGCLVETDRLEIAARNCASAAQSAGSRHKAELAKIAAIKAEIEALSWIEQADQYLVQLRAMQERVQTSAAQIGRAQQLMSWYYSWTQRRVSLEEARKGIGSIDVPSGLQFVQDAQTRASLLERANTMLAWRNGWQRETTLLNDDAQRGKGTADNVAAELATVTVCPLCNRPL